MRNFPDAPQTPKGFPSKKRPEVLRAFFKNGHNYKKGYGIKAITLGSEITQWWDEITSTGNTTDICFGGPTGIYTIVVLMSWWCTLLKGRPDTELTDCLHVLKEIDRVILAAVQDITNQPTTSSPNRSSGTPTTLPPQTCGVKRPIPEEPSSRKRLCPGKA